MPKIEFDKLSNKLKIRIRVIKNPLICLASTNPNFANLFLMETVYGIKHNFN